jgi:uncharacterized protein DUF4861
MTGICWKVLLSCALANIATGQGHENEWLLPNFDLRLSVQVSNPGKKPAKALATLSITEARKVAPEFPGRLAFALLLAKPGESRPATFLSSQADDLDADGIPDQFDFPVELAPEEHRQVDVYYSTKLVDTVSYSKQVQAKHTYGYNREVAALESELIGYRTYGGFFLDFMGRSAGRFGLNNDLAGYVSIYRDLGVGRDVFHIGKTLGLGGVFLRRNEKVWQPPMNVPTYAHKPSPDVVPHYRVVAQGPIRAIVEATLHDWNLDGDVIGLRALYMIDAGESHVRCHVEATPIKMRTGIEYEVGFGVRQVSAESVTTSPGHVIVTGRQNQRDGDIGLGFYYDPQAFTTPTNVQTEDGGNHALVSRNKLRAGETVSADYSVAGAWSGSGITNLRTFLEGVDRVASTRLAIGELRFAKTPRPEKVEAEAQ